MTGEYDPKLQALFTQAEEALENEEFIDNVMARIDRSRRRTLVLWIIIAAIVVTCFALLAEPLMSAMVLVSRLLPAELVAVDTGWLKLLVSPINSVAAAIAIGALALRKFYLWIFR